jgi:hypothetical protein
MFREGYRLLADRVIWTRVRGEVRAQGNVRLSTPEGDRAYGETVTLDDELRDGVIENLLVVLENGGRSPPTAPTRVKRRHDAGARHLHGVRGGRREWLPRRTRPGRSRRPA